MRLIFEWWWKVLSFTLTYDLNEVDLQFSFLTSLIVCWLISWLRSAGTFTCVILFGASENSSQYESRGKKAVKNSTACSHKKKKKQALLALNQPTGKHLLYAECQQETQASKAAETPHRSHRASSQPLQVSISTPVTLQMGMLHHWENWCFWAVQSGVEHIRVQSIREQQSTERQAYPPLEGSNLYHLTLKDLWV